VGTGVGTVLVSGVGAEVARSGVGVRVRTGVGSGVGSWSCGGSGIRTGVGCWSRSCGVVARARSDVT
jgi:hypothetical protein